MKIVIFELDETLLFLDVEWGNVRKEILEFAEKEKVDINLNQPLLLLSNSISNTLNRKKKVDSIFKKYEDKIFQTLHQAKRYVPFPNMVELVNKLHEKGYILAIASANCESTIKSALNGLKIAEKFKVICGRDTLQKAKPSPEPLIYILNETKINKEDAIFIGDSETDRECAQLAGVKFFKISTNDYQRKIDAKNLDKILISK